jgi:hypothetical protein
LILARSYLGQHVVVVAGWLRENDALLLVMRKRRDS